MSLDDLHVAIPSLLHFRLQIEFAFDEYSVNTGKVDGWMDGNYIACKSTYSFAVFIQIYLLQVFLNLAYIDCVVHFLCLSEMAELLFHMEKLRGLMKKYSYVVQRYHVQYLAQFDALVINDTIQVSNSNNTGHLFVIHAKERSFYLLV